MQNFGLFISYTGGIVKFGKDNALYAIVGLLMANERLGSKGLFNKHEFVRIIIQSLYSLGYTKSAACLESESNISCKSLEFELLESQINDANWDDCIGSITKLKGLSDETRASALFLVFEQCVLECLSRGDNSLALEILRKQISRLQVNKEKVHKLAVGLVSLKELGLSKLDYEIIQDLRSRLLIELGKLLPPPITLPERRLEHLVEMATTAQIENCMYHTSNMTSLYEDHHCNRDDFPTETIQVV